MTICLCRSFDSVTRGFIWTSCAVEFISEGGDTFLCLLSVLLEWPTGTRPGEVSWQCLYWELGRDSQSLFPSNADLGPKIEECSLNLNLPHQSQSFHATKLSHEKPSKGISPFVKSLRMHGRRVLFDLACAEVERYYYLLITDIHNFICVRPPWKPGFARDNHLGFKLSLQSFHLHETLFVGSLHVPNWWWINHIDG